MTRELPRIRVTARIENLEDVYMPIKESIKPSRVRAFTVDDAMVDPKMLGLMIPSRLIDRLGLRPTTLRPTRTPRGTVLVQMYDAVRLTIQERDCVMEVQEIQGDSPILIGRIPLLALDWVIDPIGEQLIGNPEHGGEWMAEAF
jgi:hypothetical protein